MACSELNVWTKFWKIDIISAIKNVDPQIKDCTLPVEIARFECHMSKPVRLHNSYKYSMSKKYRINGVAVQGERVLPEHTFAEGAEMTLADIIIFACVHTLFSKIEEKSIFELAPLTVKWYKLILQNEKILQCLDVLKLESAGEINADKKYYLPKTENQSLYKSDSKRYKPKNRCFTRQNDIESSLEMIKNSEILVNLDDLFCKDDLLDWTNIPFEATPEGGHLPTNRLQKKIHQLECLCKPVLKLAKPGQTIVDFCSGGGHLGILLAYLLPKCNVILLENKSESMKKAKYRLYKLSLNNIIFYQCNKRRS